MKHKKPSPKPASSAAARLVELDEAGKVPPELMAQLPGALIYAQLQGVAEPVELVCRSMIVAVEQFNPSQGDLVAFFWGILHIQCYYARLAEARRQRRFDELTEVLGLAGAEPPDHESIARLRAALARGLREVPKNRRHVFWHRIFHGRKNAELLMLPWAQQQKLTPNAARSRFCRARKVMRRYLEPFRSPQAQSQRAPPQKRRKRKGGSK